MEVCGGQTHSIVRFGLDEMLPDAITLIHGPGCPVCVTPIEMIDKAIAIASREDVIFCSYGDMLRVPGSTTDLLTVKSAGGDVRIVYSPIDAVTLARESIPIDRLYFLRSDSRRRPPPTSWRLFRPSDWEWKTSPCWSPMSGSASDPSRLGFATKSWSTAFWQPDMFVP